MKPRIHLNGETEMCIFVDLAYKCVIKVKVFYLDQENTLTLEMFG